MVVIDCTLMYTYMHEDDKGCFMKGHTEYLDELGTEEEPKR